MTDAMLRVAATLAESGLHENELPFPAWGFGAAIGGTLVILLLVTFSVRNIGKSRDLD